MTGAAEPAQTSRWICRAGTGIGLVALGLLCLKAIDIPLLWTERPFGSFMGREAEFLGSILLTLPVLVVAAMLLWAARWMSGCWGSLTGACLAVALVLIIQDAVLARAVYRGSGPDVPAHVARQVGPLTHRGTTFFDGAGMEGPYITEMVQALSDAGIGHVRAAIRYKWSNGALRDSVDAFFKRDRDDSPIDLSAMGTVGEQFNLIGYSYGALQAAQAAMDYADRGGKVDHLILIAAPISRAFLTTLEKHPNIGQVDIMDLTRQDDPIHAGMTAGDLLLGIPRLAWQFADGKYGAPRGHFYFGGTSPQSTKRRRTLATQLFELGLR